MSLLNSASDGYPNTLIALFRALWDLKSGTVGTEVLEKHCSAFEGDERLHQSLLRWSQLGLFHISESRVVSFGQIVSEQIDEKTDVEEATTKLPKILRKLVFLPENNTNFWGVEDGTASDLVRGLAWLLAQNMSHIDLGSFEKLQPFEIAQLPNEKIVVQNDVRWTTLRAWAKYLGFMNQVGSSSIIDPYVAVFEELEDTFAAEAELDVVSFISRLANNLPVLDQGDYRLEVEGNLDPAQWNKPPSSSHCSSSLSLALMRLHDARKINLVKRSDSPSVLTFHDFRGVELEQYTHIVRGK
jgi:hypothetical protein